MESICRIISPNQHGSGLTVVNFVYETQHSSLKQPFFGTLYKIMIITKGSCEIRSDSGDEYSASEGDIFIFFPKVSYYVKGSEDFLYIYVSFNGSEASSLLANAGVFINKPLFKNYNHLLGFWKRAIWRTNSSNACFVAESVLFYTLSFFCVGDAENGSVESEDVFDTIIEYVDNNYFDPALSLKKLGQIFSYNEKYLSYRFKKRTGSNFSSYLNSLRIRNAMEHLKNKELSISRVAEMVGFSDHLYFPKVFKRITGVTPAKYRKDIMK